MPDDPWRQEWEGFSDSALQKIAEIFRETPGRENPQTPERDQIAAKVYGQPVQDLVEASFIGVIETEARWAATAVRHLDLERKLVEKELSDIEKHLLRLMKSLNDMSMSARVLLPVEFDPIQLADDLECARPYIIKGKQKLADTQRLPHGEQRKADIAKEVALRILRAAAGFGIKPAATFEAVTAKDPAKPGNKQPEDGHYVSPAVKLMHAVGEGIGLPLSPDTWKRHIASAFKVEPGKH